MHRFNAIAKEPASESSETPADELDPRDPDDFAQLVHLHHRELLVYARALTREESTARDIVQEAFIVAFDKIDAFDVTRDFPTWMRGIVRNKWREWVRKNKRYVFTDKNIAEIDADVAQWQAESAAGNRTVFDVLETCLDRLPDTLRDTVHAFYYRGENGEEAAKSLGIAPAAVRIRLQRARDLLKDCVDRKLAERRRQQQQPSSTL
ncbi:MAG: sigma-70 family RNA polymerase sigma factor [Verrucomicrobiales bacterium]|nr:sigma-70 family RNA polymerase sigma factor [Verrucomicrobiales bacterium]